MTLLTKTILRGYRPGNPGSPGFPGQPARPAYTSVEAVCIGEHHFLVPIYDDGMGGVSHTSGELLGYIVKTIPGGCHYETVFHPAEPAVPSIPAVPATQGQHLINNRIGWNAGAYSIESLDADVQTTFRIQACPGGIFIGFVQNPIGVVYTTMTHAFYFRHPIVDVWESGILKWGVTNFTLEDDFRIERVAGNVSYWKNDVKLYQSTVPSVGALHVDCSMYSGGDTVN